MLHNGHNVLQYDLLQVDVLQLLNGHVLMLFLHGRLARCEQYVQQLGVRRLEFLGKLWHGRVVANGRVFGLVDASSQRVSTRVKRILLV